MPDPDRTAIARAASVEAARRKRINKALDTLERDWPPTPEQLRRLAEMLLPESR